MPGPASPPAEPADSSGPLVLFDGVCNLCNGAVRRIVERDDRGVFRFGSLQWASARRAVEAHAGAEAWRALPDSLVLLDDDGVHVRSTAALRIARRLGAPWSVLSVLLLIPRPLRDAVYDWIARNRYGWFGRKDACMVPTPELAGRFLPVDETEPRKGR